MYTLSIIIVNYRVARLVEQCLLSVERAIEGIRTEVWVVDNHSEDGSVDYLRSRFPWVNFIANQENLGFAKANNQAIRRSNAAYILTLNPDTIIAEDTLQQCLLYMQEHKECGAIGIKMHNIRGKYLRESKRGFPNSWASFCKLSGLTRLFPHSKTLAPYYMGHLSEHKMHKVEVLSCAFAFFRQEALDKVGIFDETFFMYGEDIDLSYRIHLGGYSCHYLPTTMIHYKGESSILNSQRYIRSFYGAMELFYKKYYPNERSIGRYIIPLAIRLLMLVARIKGFVGFYWGKLSGRKAEINLREVSLPLDVESLPPREAHLLVQRDDYSFRTIIDEMIRHSDRQYTYHFRGRDGIIISPQNHK